MRNLIPAILLIASNCAVAQTTKIYDPTDSGRSDWMLGKDLNGKVLSIKTERTIGSSFISYHDEKNRIIKTVDLSGGYTSTKVWQGDVLAEENSTNEITYAKETLITKNKYFYGIDNCLIKKVTEFTKISPQGTRESSQTDNYACSKTSDGYRRMHFQSDSVVTSNYDKSGRIVDEKIKVNRNPEPTFGYVVEYNDSPSELPESTHMIMHWTDGKGNKTSVKTNEYYDKYGNRLAHLREDGWHRFYYEDIDKNGNWTKLREVSGSGKITITTREIKYR